MKKRLARYVLLGLAAYAMFLIATVPAGWLGWAVTRVSDELVVLDQGKGTIWRGNGRLVMRYPKGTVHDLGYTEWRVNALGLLLARLQTTLTLSGAESDAFARLTVSPWRLSLQDTRLSASAELASRFHPPAALLAPRGRLRLRTDTLTLDREGLHGNAEVYWDQAGSDLSSVQPLGDYRLEVAADGQRALLKLATSDGPLELTGQGRWQMFADGRLQLTGLARAKSRAPELGSLLRILGRDLGDGRTAFRLDTRLRLALGWPPL